tara:strand:- start:1217 stop:1393 length:177 start_codon:yes stop_codon:yes gene_type:complete
LGSVKIGLLFSVKRLIGITGLKCSISNKIGVPLTKEDVERKIVKNHKVYSWKDLQVIN